MSKKQPQSNPIVERIQREPASLSQLASKFQAGAFMMRSELEDLVELLLAEWERPPVVTLERTKELLAQGERNSKEFNKQLDRVFRDPGAM